MNLVATSLPAQFVQRLSSMNIRELEALLSIVANPRGLSAISQALSLPTSEVSMLVDRLRHEHPEVDFEPAGGPYRHMGHVPPPRRVPSPTENS